MNHGSAPPSRRCKRKYQPLARASGSRSVIREFHSMKRWECASVCAIIGPQRKLAGASLTTDKEHSANMRLRRFRVKNAYGEEPTNAISEKAINPARNSTTGSRPKRRFAAPKSKPSRKSDFSSRRTVRLSQTMRSTGRRSRSISSRRANWLGGQQRCQRFGQPCWQPEISNSPRKAECASSRKFAPEPILILPRHDVWL